MYKATKILTLAVLLTKTFAESTELSRDKYLHCLISYLSSRPGQTLVYRDGDLISINKKSDHVHNVQVNVRAGNDANIETLTNLTCTADIVEEYDLLKVVDGTTYCKEEEDTLQAFRPVSFSDDAKPVEDIGKFVMDAQKNKYDWSMMMDDKPSVRRRVRLGSTRSDRIVLRSNDVTDDNSANKATTTRQDGSQWRVPIDTSNKLAEDLAALAVNQINMHYPGVPHTLSHIITLQRQPKASGEMHFVLHFNVKLNNCKDIQDASCLETKTCRVIYVRKPWLQLPDGSKYTAMNSNNCTDEHLLDEQSPKGSTFISRNRMLESRQVNNELEAPKLGEPASKKLLIFSNHDYLGHKLVRYKKTKQVESDSAKKLGDPSKIDKSHQISNNVFFPKDFEKDNVENFKKNVKLAKLAEESLEFIDDKRTKSIIKIHSVKTMPRQIEIIYDFAYTLCINDVSRKCILLEGEPIHTCKAVISGKEWLEEKKKISVSCKKSKDSIQKKKRDNPNNKNTNFYSDSEKGRLLDNSKSEIAELTQTAISHYT